MQVVDVGDEDALAIEKVAVSRTPCRTEGAILKLLQ